MLEQREKEKKEKMSSPVRRTAAWTNRKMTPVSSPDRPSASITGLRSPPSSPASIRRRKTQTKPTCVGLCLWRSSHKSVCIAAGVFFCWSFLAVNLLVVEEVSNAQHRPSRSMLMAGPHAWLRQARPVESNLENGVSIPTMHEMNLTSTTANPITATPASTPTWQNQHNVVHVIQTRLFQFQPDFLTLGLARLEIFKAFTVPSLSHQTTPNFLWIIRTDPALHHTLKSGLLEAVQHLDNVLVIASNYNPEGFRGSDAIANITNDSNSVWAGSWDLLQSYHAAAQFRVVVESRLDADDALSTEFCESAQQQAAEELKDHDKAWTVGCAEFHVEWQQYSPWNETAKDKGALVGLAGDMCVTPGLTFSYGSTASRSDIPTTAHHKVHAQIPACDDDQTTECLYRFSLPDDMPLAIRARTVTSAGMNDLFLEDSRGTPGKLKGMLKSLQKSSWRHIQNDLWETLPKTCGLDAAAIWNVRTYLKEHETGIASDNLKGQCTKGHSCKEGSKAALKKLLETTSS